MNTLRLFLVLAVIGGVAATIPGVGEYAHAKKKKKKKKKKKSKSGDMKADEGMKANMAALQAQTAALQQQLKAAQDANASAAEQKKIADELAASQLKEKEAIAAAKLAAEAEAAAKLAEEKQQSDLLKAQLKTLQDQLAANQSTGSPSGGNGGGISSTFNPVGLQPSEEVTSGGPAGTVSVSRAY
jgi:hypothetical protein